MSQVTKKAEIVSLFLRVDEKVATALRKQAEDDAGRYPTSPPSRSSNTSAGSGPWPAALKRRNN